MILIVKNQKCSIISEINIVFRSDIKISTISQNEIYSRPGPIINKSLCKIRSNGKYVLNKDLQIVYDYVSVNEKAWKYLKNWYNYDLEIPL